MVVRDLSIFRLPPPTTITIIIITKIKVPLQEAKAPTVV
jgi:hypothetical protein